MNYGTDMDSHGKLDSKGQISLISGVDNVYQSLKNSILTYKGTYSYIDADYGSLLKEYLGFDNNHINQQIICLELENVALKDPRIIDAVAEYEYGKYILRVKLYDGEEFELEDLI